MAVDKTGRCVFYDESEGKGKKNDKEWKCSAFCKPLTQSEVDSILLLKRKFEESVREVRKKLDTCDPKW